MTNETAERGAWFDAATSAAAERGWVNRAHVGAFRRGWLAKIGGRPRSSPYVDHRGGRHLHITTWSRSFTKAWTEGYDAAAGAGS